MQKIITIFTVLLITLTPSQAFYMNANCYLNSGAKAECVACNYQGRPVYCQMQVQGITYNGFWFNGFQNTHLFPGQCMTGYVFANNPYTDPLANANAQVNCRY